MSARIFTIANQKGGVGKTTTAINLAAALANRKIPTLVVDLDPQANATSGLGLLKEEGISIYGPLFGEGSAEDKVRETTTPYLYAIPSEVDLAATEIELAQEQDYLLRLRNALAGLKESGRFEAIILDCPPALGLLSMNSLATADYLLIALQCEYLALEGLSQILKVTNDLKEAGVNPNLELGGIIMTMFDIRTNLSRQVVDEVKKHFSREIFKTLIPRSVRLGESPSFGQTIFQYDPLSPGAEAYKALSDEVAKRFSLKPAKAK